jgi:hypothetical protein
MQKHSAMVDRDDLVVTCDRGRFERCATSMRLNSFGCDARSAESFRFIRIVLMMRLGAGCQGCLSGALLGSSRMWHLKRSMLLLCLVQAQGHDMNSRATTVNQPAMNGKGLYRNIVGCLGAVVIVLAAMGCGETEPDVYEREVPATEINPSIVSFTAEPSRDLSYEFCRYVLTYDRSNTAQISKTCRDNIDPNGTTNRTYSTLIDEKVQTNILAGLEQLQTIRLLSYYGSAELYAPRHDDYDFRFTTADGRVSALHVEEGSDARLPDGLRQIYRALLDGDLRMMQNANDALPQLLPIEDDKAAQTTVRISSEISGGGGPPCICDGNSTSYGYGVRTKTISADGAIEQWSGCLKLADSADGPNRYTRCKTYNLENTTLDPARWVAIKRAILSAEPLNLADHYPCGSYLECPSDVSSISLTIGVGQAGRTTSWPGGEEAQLPARLQYILSVLP